MCEPTTIMMAATVAMTAISSYSQQKAQTELAEANQESALKARNTKNAQIEYNYRRDQQASADQQVQNATQGMRATGTALTSAGESGVSGLSVDSMLNDMYRQEANLNSGLVTGLQDSQAGASARFDQSQSQYESRVNSVPKGSMGKVLMDTGAAAVNSYAQYRAPKIGQTDAMFGGNSFSGRDVIRGSEQDVMLANQWRH